MRSRICIYFFILAFMMMGKVSTGQDLQYSQFYAAPLYLNPAFTGSTQLTRAGINYRNQWPSIDASFVTYSAYADHFFIDVNSGVGIMVQSDRATPVGLRNQGVSLLYAYQLPLTSSWTFRAGFEGGYFFRDLDFSKLTFGDMFDGTGYNNPTNENFNSDWKISFLDLSFGGLMYNRNVWVGFSGHHLNTPNLSLLEESGDIDNLQRKYSLHAGYRLNLMQGGAGSVYGGQSKRSLYLFPAVNYRIQGDFMQLDGGAYLDYSPVVFGVWYRGIPVRNVNNIKNNESLIFSVGMSKNGLNIGYSFDYPLSQLGLDSGGAHEISISFEFFMGDPRKPPKNIREIPCPRI